MTRLPDLLAERDRWDPDMRVGRAVVVRTFGSSPWPPGATLLVAEDGRRAGTVSGGCVEADASEQVQEALTRHATRLVRYGVADEAAWSVGLACGGTIELLVEPELRPETLDAARRSDGRAVAVPLPGDVWSLPGDPIVLTADAAGTDGEPGTVTVISGREHFVETFAPPQRLVTFGAGEVTYRLAALARELGWQIVVVDPRSGVLARDRLAPNDRIVDSWPQDADVRIGLSEADAVVVLTHDPKLDDPAIQLALERGCRYVGAIGSRRTQAERRSRLRDAGVPEESLSRVRGPVGLDLGGRQPAETALAILAEIVAAIHDRSGGPLFER